MSLVPSNSRALILSLYRSNRRTRHIYGGHFMSSWSATSSSSRYYIQSRKISSVQKSRRKKIYRILSPGVSIWLNCWYIARMFDEQLGTLYWADLPDPASTRPVNSRNVISIEHERALTTVVSSLGYRYVQNFIDLHIPIRSFVVRFCFQFILTWLFRLSTEFIQEGYRFIRGNIMIQLCRYFELPTSSQPESNSQPRVNLPSFESLIPFDSQGKWIMTASVDVINSTDPDQMLRATDELVALKQAFEGCFAFKLVDRHTLDTRVKFWCLIVQLALEGLDGQLCAERVSGDSEVFRSEASSI